MNKRAKIIAFSVILSFLIISIIFVSSVGSQDKAEEIDIGKEATPSQVISRTASSETIRNSNGEYTITLFSGRMFMDDRTRRFPNYVPVSDVVNMSREGNNLTISWFDKKVTIQPKFSLRIGQSDTEINIQELKNNHAPSVKSDSVIIKEVGGYEYGFNISGLGLTRNIMQNVYFDFSYEGLDESKDVVVSGDRILLPDGLELRFDDLKEEGFTFNVDNKNRISVGNITGKSELFLDPTITLQTGSSNSYLIADARVWEANNDTNYGSIGDLSSQKSALGKNSMRFYIKLNMTKIKTDANLDGLNITNVNISFSQGPSQANSGGVSIYRITDWINESNYLLNETEITWNNQPCGNDNNYNLSNLNICNITPISNSLNISGSFHFDITNEFNRSYGQTNISFVFNKTQGNGGWEVSSKEGSSSLRPKILISYIPLINILTPTASQILTDNTPTNNFNITTAVNMTTCLWTNSSGVVNYTMASLNGTRFSNNSISTLADGTHTINFYCNQSSDGAWRTSDSVTFDIDSINVTTCRDLTVARRNYTLRKDIYEAHLGDCFLINAQDIGFNGNWHNITINNTDGGGSGSIISIQSNSAEIYNFTNITFLEAGEPAINFDAFAGEIHDINLIYYKKDSSIFSSELVAIYLDEQASINNINRIESNTEGITAGRGGVLVSELEIGNIKNISAPTPIKLFLKLSNSYIYNTTLRDSSGNTDVISLDVGNIRLINVTYEKGEEVVIINNNLTRQWYFTSQVNNSAGNPLQNANITIMNVTGSIISSVLTDSNGRITRQEITEYINNGTRTFHTPHTINISLIGYTANSTIINLTSTQNYNHNVKLSLIISVDIAEPKPQSYSYNNSLSLNYTITNGTALDSCWYYVFNSTNNYEISNRTITCNALSPFRNETFNVSKDQTYTLHFHINETGGVSATDSVTFSVSTVKPSVALDYPPNNTYFSNGTNTYFNFTATDSNGINTCRLYGDWGSNGWHTNYTWINPTNATRNYTAVNITGDNNYMWNVLCNDTLGNENFGLNNLTFTLDTISPLITIDPISTTDGSTLVSFTSSYTELNCNNTFYSVFDINDNIENNNENISMTCANTNSSFIINAFASYNLQVYVRDKAGHENSTRRSFNVQLADTGGGGGGGGGGIPSTEKVTVVGVIQPSESIERFEALEREIIYARINDLCSEKITSEELALIDYSNECFLTKNDLQEVIRRLENNDVKISLEDLILFYENYKDRQFFQGFENIDTITKFSLFSSIVGERELLKLNPSRVDKYSFFNVLSGNHTIRYTVTSNKPLKGCEVVSETPALTCAVTNTTLKVSYFIGDTNFVSRIFSGTVSVITDAPEDKKEVKTLNIIFRAYNFGKPINLYLFSIPIFALVIIVIVLLFLVLVVYTRGRSKNTIKEFISIPFRG